jgi:prolyl 4-hydroxylase
LFETSIQHALDWSMLAEPQGDQYDTEVILALASTTTSPERPKPYVRTPIGSSPSSFDGHVAIRYVYHDLPDFIPLNAQYPDAPANHRNIQIAAEHVRTWPVAYKQCQRLLEAIHPGMDPGIPLESTEIYRGSLCHSYECLFGTLWATIFCPIALAEAIVHEMAHQKMRVLGTSFESARSIVGNNPSDLYISPIIKDRERPMTAVLHAEYSYVHVTALDIQLFKAEREASRRKVLSEVLERNMLRIEEGYATIQEHFIPGEHGREFMEGFLRWTERTIREAKELLGHNGKHAVPSVQAATAASVKNGATQEAPVGTARPLPNIDTSANRIIMLDRQVEVLLTVKNPHVVVLGNVLSDEECDELIRYSEPRLVRSSVVGNAEGAVKVHENRTSRGVMLRRGETAIVQRIEARLAMLAKWPVERAEGLQVLRYGVDDEYRPHQDWIDPNVPGLRKYLEFGGQRLGTFVLYLSNVEAGGSTVFPSIGLEVKPRKGGAVFFVNTDSQYVPDKLTLHGGSPVIKGEKFVANKWLRQSAC